MSFVFGNVAPGHWSKVTLVYEQIALISVLIIGARIAGYPVSLHSTNLLVFAGIASLVWAVGSVALHLNDPFRSRIWLDELSLVSLLVVVETMLVAAAKLLFPVTWDEFPRIGHFLILFWPAVTLPRMLLFRRMTAQTPALDDVLIVGTGPLARETAKQLEEGSPRSRVLGFIEVLDTVPMKRCVPAERILGTIDKLEECLRTLPVGEVYVTVRPAHGGRATQTVIRECERYGVPFALPALNYPMGRARPVVPQAVSDGYLHFVTFESRPVQRAVKRLFDIVASALGLLVLSPLLIAVAAAIKLTSRGPIFFRQNRVGLHGRTFGMLKFRSMVVNAEALKAQLAQKNEQTGPVFKMKNDPRITKVGRFIRKYSIDELPQLFNVLRGDMSIVGPRPPVPPEVAQYEPWQRRRLSVRPGLTCIWQVSGRNEISFEEWMYLDMQYIDNWTLKSDLALILKTVPVVVTGKGAS